MLTVSFSLDDPRWQTLLKAQRAFFRALLRATMQQAAPDGHYRVGVALIDDGAMQTLNRNWRGKDKPTNVLSFPLVEDLVAAQKLLPCPAPSSSATRDRANQIDLGDIVIAWETIVREARNEGKTKRDHVAHLLVHGMLHLLGHDHMKKREAQKMEDLEIALLAAAGIADPYN